MNQLSKEAMDFMQAYCIANWTPILKDRNSDQIQREVNIAFGGMSAGLTTPEIYEKAGLISLEDAMGFAEWVSQSEYFFKKNLWYSISEDKDAITTAQLFQIYKQQKP